MRLKNVLVISVLRLMASHDRTHRKEAEQEASSLKAHHQVEREREGATEGLSSYRSAPILRRISFRAVTRTDSRVRRPLLQTDVCYLLVLYVHIVYKRSSTKPEQLANND